MSKASPGEESLPKHEMLRKRADFDLLFGTGKRASHGSVSIVHREAAGRKVGFAVSSRVSGAARRNRARRLMREAYRKNRARMKGNAEFVVVAGEGAWAMNLAEIERDLLACLEKAGIIE